MAHDEEAVEEQEEWKSRSQLKREFNELKELAAQLVELSPGRLAAFPLSDRTRKAILDAQSMKRAALKRQVGHIANRIENEDPDAIRAFLAGDVQPVAEEVGPTRAERWRDQLLAGDDDFLMQFVEEHPQFDRQQLRQLLRKARKERERGKPPEYARQLLDHLAEHE